MSTNYEAISMKPIIYHRVDLGTSYNDGFMTIWEDSYFPTRNKEALLAWLKSNVLTGKYRIEDEYGNPVSYDEMVEIITKKEDCEC